MKTTIQTRQEETAALLEMARLRKDAEAAQGAALAAIESRLREIRSAFAEKYTRMVWRLAYNQMRGGDLGERFGSIEDLAQEGFRGLLRALECFNPRQLSKRTGKPTRFMTYAYTSVRRFIFMACTREGSTVIHVSANARRRLLTMPDLAEDKIALAAIRALAPFQLGSFDELGHCDALARWDPDPVAEVDERAHLRAALAKLPERLAYVLERRFWHGEKLRIIAARLGITKERTRQLQVKALKMLRSMMGAVGSDAYAASTI